MKTYIINLESSKKRREHILREVKKHNLDYEFINAVNGKNLTKSEKDRLCDQDAVRNNPDWLTPGAIGAALSHHKVYQKIVSDNVEAALVVEDDLILPNNLNSILQNIKADLHKNEVILIFYQSFNPLKLSLQGKSELADNYKLMYPLSLNGVAGAVCYIITKEAAKSLVDYILPIRLAADSWLEFQREKKIDGVRCLYPMSIELTNMKSTISSTSQSWFRRIVTEGIDKYKIPPFYNILKNYRANSIKSRSVIELVEEKSTLEL